MFKSLSVGLFLVCSISLCAQKAKVGQWRDSANHWLELEENVKALPFLDSISAYEPENIKLFELIVQITSGLGLYNKAFNACVHLTQQQSANPARFNDAGWFAILDNKPAKAIYYLQSAIDIDPSVYSPYLNMGHAYALLKDQQKLLYYYEYAVEYFTDPEKVETAAITDIRLLTQLKLYPYDSTNLFPILRSTAKQYNANARATALLDSIAHAVYEYHELPNSINVINLKKQFCIAERQNKIWRYHVLNNFYWDIGLYETQNNNIVRSFNEYIIPSFQLAFAVGDTLSLIRKWLVYGQLGNDPLDQLLDSAVKFSRIIHEPLLLLKSYWAKADYFDKKYKSDSVLHYSRLAFSIAQQMTSRDANEFQYGKEYALAASAGRMYDIYLVKRFCDSATYYFGVNSKFFLKYHPSLENRLSEEQNMATGLYKCGRYDESIALAFQTISNYDEYKKQLNLSKLYELIGLNYYKKNDAGNSEKFFRRSIEVYKEFTKNAENKRGLTVLNVHCNLSFEYLKKIYVKKKDAEALFALAEEAKQNVVYLRLSNSYYPEKIKTLDQVKNSLRKNEAIISYGSSGRISWGYSVAANSDKSVVVTENVQQFEALFNDPKMKKMTAKIDKMAEAVVKNTGKINYTSEDIATARIGLLANIFNMSIGGSASVRGLTIKNAGNQMNAAAEELDAMNNLLYTFFVAPLEDVIVGKDILYISTEQSTSYFPFEVLKNKEGKYLGEIYNIVYVPSFTIQSLLKQHTEGTNNNLLAFGNPDYSRFDPGEMQGKAYDLAAMGYTNWKDLPGTKVELDSLRAIILNAEIFQSGSVSESQITGLSEKGKLKEFGFLHFALHGMTRIDNFEDNALIVTEPKGSKQDGFLRFWEIADLDIHARLVCLSACETAVTGFAESNDVNLPLSFIMAGANAVLASSWKIDDKATGIFMSQFYKKIFRDHRSPSEALFLTRKQFITGEFGDVYKAPMYWGAFKYTGY